MPVRVIEDWSRREFVPGSSGLRVFSVDGSVDGRTPLTEATAQLQVALQASATYRSIDPLDSSLVVPDKGIDTKMIVPGLFEVTVRYEPLNRRDWTVGGGGSLIGRKWRIGPPELIDASEPADANYASEASVNSVGTLMGELFQRRSFAYRLRMRRFERPDDLLTRMLSYAGKWNSDVVTLPKFGVAQIGELLIESIMEVEPTISKPGVVDIEYSIIARPRVRIDAITSSSIQTQSIWVPGHWTRRLDAGFYCHGQDSNGVVALCEIVVVNATGTNAARTPQQPVRLNGRGVPFDLKSFNISSSADNPWTPVEQDPLNSDSVKTEKTADGAFIWRDETEGPIAFAPLNIEGNN
jgi:hypothetical protein